MSILQFCRAQKFGEAISLLQKSKYDPQILNAQDDAGRTALHYSVLADQPLLCQLILESAGSPNIQDGQGQTAFHLAVSQEKLSKCTAVFCDASLCHFNWTLQDLFGRTVLHWICAKGYHQLLRQIIDVHANNEYNDEEMDEKKAPSMTATAASNDDMLAALNLQNKSGQTCMHWAVDKNNWRCVQILLEMAGNGVLDLTIRDNDELLAFDLCADEHQKQLVWDKTKLQMNENEAKAQQNAVQKFAVSASTSVDQNDSTQEKPLKVKSKAKKKMKIKLKK